MTSTLKGAVLFANNGEKDPLIKKVHHPNPKSKFDWFDAVEKIDVTTPYAKQVWTTEVIKRDKLFLDKLGVSL